MGFEAYLVENVNQMHTLLINAETYPEEEESKLLEASVIACHTLKRLTDDPSFHRAVNEMAYARIDERGRTTREFTKIVESIESFEEFLKIEYQILIKGDLFPDVATEVIRLSRNALEQVRERAQPASEVIDAAKTLRDQACDLANDLIVEAKRNKTWHGIKDRIKRIMQGIGGAALIGLNAVAVIPTAGTPVASITLAGAAVSAAIGASVIQNAASPAKAHGAAG